MIKVFLYLFMLIALFNGFNNGYGSEIIKDKLEVDNTLVFSYIPHPAQQKHYIPLLDKAYKNLGFKVRFIPLKSTRGLIEANKGAIDGDVIRWKNIENNYPNLIIVPPTIDDAIISLVCVKSVPCQKNILNDKSKVVGYVSGDGIRKIVEQYSAEFYPVIDYHSISKMFNAKRFEYIIVIESKKYPLKLILQDFQANSEALVSFTLHHVINKKHAKLAIKVEEEIKRILKNEEGF